MYRTLRTFLDRRFAWRRAQLINNNKLEIVPYDPTWPAAFTAEAIRLRTELGTLDVAGGEHRFGPRRGPPGTEPLGDELAAMVRAGQLKHISALA